MENEKYCFLPVDELRKDIELKYTRTPSPFAIELNNLLFQTFCIVDFFFASYKQQHRYFARNICMCLVKQQHSYGNDIGHAAVSVHPDLFYLFMQRNAYNTTLLSSYARGIFEIETEHTPCFVRCWEEGKQCVRCTVPVPVPVSMRIQDYGMGELFCLQ